MDLAGVLLSALREVRFEPTQRLAVAFSGGADSLALLMAANLGLGSASVVALHIDHALRPESAQEAEHSLQLAESLGIESICRRIARAEIDILRQTHGPEGAFREARYAHLTELCQQVGASCLVTGHHAEDHLETLLLALVRGSGLTGLAGPRKSRCLGGNLVLLRPFLGVPREELISFIKERRPDLTWIEDATNKDPGYKRNAIRQRIIPELVRLADGMPPLIRSAQQLASDRESLERLVEAQRAILGVDTSDDRLDLSKVVDFDDPILPWLVRSYLAKQGDGYPPAQHVVRRVLEALREPGRTRWIDIRNLRLVVESQTLGIEDRQALGFDPPEQIIQLGQLTTCSQLEVCIEAQVLKTTDSEVPHSNDEVHFDLAGLRSLEHNKLILRAARAGDRFIPYGRKSSVRLLRWLANQGVSRSMRRRAPVVVLGGEILWVVSVRRSCHAPVTVNTLERLSLWRRREQGFGR